MDLIDDGLNSIELIGEKAMIGFGFCIISLNLDFKWLVSLLAFLSLVEGLVYFADLPTEGVELIGLEVKA